MRRPLFNFTLVLAMITMCSVLMEANTAANQAALSKPFPTKASWMESEIARPGTCGMSGCSLSSVDSNSFDGIIASPLEGRISPFAEPESDFSEYKYEGGERNPLAGRLNQLEPSQFLDTSRDRLGLGDSLTFVSSRTSKLDSAPPKSELATSIIQTSWAPSSEPTAMLLFGSILIAIGSMLNRLSKARSIALKERHREVLSLSPDIHR
jgi:hypothetical protein